MKLKQIRLAVIQLQYIYISPFGFLCLKVFATKFYQDGVSQVAA